jgi:hypothetical protein
MRIPRVATRSGVWATALRRTHLRYLSTTSTSLCTPRLAELGDALDMRSVGASPALRLHHPGCVLCRFVVYRWCPASTAWIPHLGWLIALGRRQTLRFRIQIKVLWPGTQKHRGLDSLVPFTCVSRFIYYRILVMYKRDCSWLPHMKVFAKT